MLYKAVAVLNDDVKLKRPYAKSMQKYTGFYGEKSVHKTFIFVCDITASHKNEAVTLGIISDTDCYIEDMVNAFSKETGIEYKDIAIQEVTVSAMDTMLSDGRRRDFIEDDNSIKQLYDIGILNKRRSNTAFSENILNCCRDRSELIAKAKSLPCENELIPELERIYENTAFGKIICHPVHYVIMSEGHGDMVLDILLSALWSNSRIRSRRYTVIDIDNRDFCEENCNMFYKAADMGTVVINIKEKEENNRSPFIQMMDRNERLKLICSLARTYKGRVLTIFNIPVDCRELLEKIYKLTDNMCYVEISEGNLNGEKARQYLSGLAENNGVPEDDNLFENIDEAENSYLVKELDNIFDIWLNKKLTREIYPQYSNFSLKAKTEGVHSPIGDAYKELMSMTGLENVKAQINKIIKYNKTQKLFSSKHTSISMPSMHMVFTGAPGTAKTTVARLFAQIMKDNEILSKGELYEMGRSDLVGMYVGWTAKIVKNKFRMAAGSVLFIDEAYSLVDGSKSFGDEAINTIVQEMENNRDDIIVIFAGYPKEMESFLNKNPGLRSRISYHINFENYSAQELYSITEYMAEKDGMTLDKSVKDKLLPIFDKARAFNDFGNGRYARNIYEKAFMSQRCRLADMELDKITDADEALMLAEDFDIEIPQRKEIKIGF